MNQESKREDSTVEQPQPLASGQPIQLEKPPSIVWMLVPAAVLALLAYFSR